MRFGLLVRCATAAGLVCASLAFAGDFTGDKDKNEKQKAASSQVVDSGSFGVFVNKQRVVTESFNIHQENGN